MTQINQGRSLGFQSLVQAGKNEKIKSEKKLLAIRIPNVFVGNICTAVVLNYNNNDNNNDNNNKREKKISKVRKGKSTSS